MPKPRYLVGTAIHGFASGASGRDSYACRRVEAVGADWVVTRNTLGLPEMALLDWLMVVNPDDLSYCEGNCKLKEKK